MEYFPDDRAFGHGVLTSHLTHARRSAHCEEVGVHAAVQGYLFVVAFRNNRDAAGLDQVQTVGHCARNHSVLHRSALRALARLHGERVGLAIEYRLADTTTQCVTLCHMHYEGSADQWGAEGRLSGLDEAQQGVRGKPCLSQLVNSL